MVVPQTHPMSVSGGRQVSLVEACLWALAVHTLVYLVLALLGVGSLLHAEVTAPQEEQEVRFTFAEATDEGQQPAASAADEVGSEPGTPVIAPPQPEPDAAASLERPQPALPPSLPIPPTLPLPGDTATENPAAPVEQVVEAPTPDPPSDGVEQGVEDGVDEPFDEPFTEDASTETEVTESPSPTDSTPDEVILEQDEPLAEADDGRFARPQQPAPGRPEPRVGRPAGPSLDERISDFGRAVERFRERTPATPTQQPRNVFEPDWSSLPPTGQTVGNLMFESGDFDWEDYGRQIYWIIWRAWHNRLLARVDDFEKWAQQTSTAYLDHVNGVRFTIQSNGQISGIELELESGSMPFDLSAIEGLDESVLPPLPEGFPRDSEAVHVQFFGYGPVRSMRRGLEQYKSRGWF